MVSSRYSFSGSIGLGLLRSNFSRGDSIKAGLSGSFFYFLPGIEVLLL